MKGRRLVISVEEEGKDRTGQACTHLSVLTSLVSPHFKRRTISQLLPANNGQINISGPSFGTLLQRPCRDKIVDL